MDIVGGSRSQVGGELLKGTNEISLALDTPKNGYKFIVVYTKSALAESTVPVGIDINDTISGVRDVEFPDQDLDPGVVGGTITWTPPDDISATTHFAIYWGQGSTGQNRSQINVDIPVGTNSLFVPLDTNITMVLNV
jgi:hypothetical protein